MGEPGERVGTQRTAHLWKHFIKRKDLGKYYNNWRVECRWCRQAYDKRKDDDTIPEPKVLISTTIKMKAHLKQCDYADINELGVIHSPTPLVKSSSAPKRHKTKKTTEPTSPLQPSSRIDPSDEQTLPYSTAYIWAHYTKREDLGKYHNNWYVECKHCRRAYDEQTDKTTAKEPTVLISAMAKMKTHLKKCIHIPREDLLAFHEINQKMVPLKRRRVDKHDKDVQDDNSDKPQPDDDGSIRVIVVPSHKAEEPFWLARVVAEPRKDDECVDITWLSRSSSGIYVVANDDSIPISSILCQVVVTEDTPGEFTLSNPSVDEIHQGLNAVDRPPFSFVKTEKVKTNPPRSYLKKENSATAGSGGHEGGRRHPIWQFFTKRVDLGKYFTNWYVECNFCLAAHQANPDVVQRPPTMRSTIPNMQVHYDSCPNRPHDASTAPSAAPAGGASHSKEVMVAKEERLPWRCLWRHFAKRVDLPRYYFYVQVECRHCRAAFPSKTSQEPDVMISSPPLMRQHLRDCPWINFDDILDHDKNTNNDDVDDTMDKQHHEAPPSPSSVLYEAMAFTAIRCDQGFWIAQLGYDVTSAMMDKGDTLVEVTWLGMDRASDGTYAFTVDQEIPVHTIVCRVQLVHEPSSKNGGEGAFQLARDELLRIETIMRER
ncbi:unnamed protein product [Aphanomyces euteiches]